MKRLEQLLQQVDQKSYPAYKELRGSYDFKEYQLNIEHVQGDPFAAPSKLSVEVPGKLAMFPTETYQTRENRIALQDFILRDFYGQVSRFSNRAKGSGKSGVISVSHCGQEILERTGCEVNPYDGRVRVRLEVGFPANGRRICARELRKIFYEYLPICVKKSMYFERLDQKKLKETIDLAEDQRALRKLLQENRLAAFVANGSILPRESGISNRPMRGAVPFQSPKELEVTLKLPHRQCITGMGIPEGVTLIVGGGYHGKSTVLQALERGVYNHIPRDGREYVITQEHGVKLRAEDGRNIADVDISGFINNLPNKKDTHHFSTMDASGSTSQAANVAEAISGGGNILLMDEDTSATNFMVRDELMQRVVHRDQEPIIPYVERVRELYEKHGVSTILVAGSSGAYFHVADTILQMDTYAPYVITQKAKEEASHYPTLRCEAPPIMDIHQRRIPVTAVKNKTFPRSGKSGGYGTRGKAENQHQERTRIKGMGRDGFMLNKELVELRYVEQIVDGEQNLTLAYCLNYMKEHLFDGIRTVDQCVEEVERLLQEKGIAAVVGKECVPGNLAMPRREELYACVNRYRGLALKQM